MKNLLIIIGILAGNLFSQPIINSYAIPFSTNKINVDSVVTANSASKAFIQDTLVSSDTAKCSLCGNENQMIGLKPGGGGAPIWGAYSFDGGDGDTVASLASISGANAGFFTQRVAYVETTGVDATALVGYPNHAFKTIGSAITALHAVGGGMVQVGIGRFPPFTTDYYPGNPNTKNPSSVGGYNIYINGSGLPHYRADNTTLDGGTIIGGPIEFDTLNWGLSNLGVDVGTAVTNTYYSGASVDGVSSQNIGQFSPSVHPPKTGLYFKNIMVLCRSAAAIAHSFLMENFYNIYVDGLYARFGIHGVVLKGQGGGITNVHTDGHNTEAFLLKSAKYIKSMSDLYAGNIWIDTVGYGDTQDGFDLIANDTTGGGSTTDLQNISGANIVITGVQVGMGFYGDLSFARTIRNMQFAGVEFNKIPTTIFYDGGVDPSSLQVNGLTIERELLANKGLFQNGPNTGLYLTERAISEGSPNACIGFNRDPHDGTIPNPNSSASQFCNDSANGLNFSTFSKGGGAFTPPSFTAPQGGPFKFVGSDTSVIASFTDTHLGTAYIRTTGVGAVSGASFGSDGDVSFVTMGNRRLAKLTGSNGHVTIDSLGTGCVTSTSGLLSAGSCAEGSDSAYARKVYHDSITGGQSAINALSLTATGAIYGASLQSVGNTLIGGGALTSWVHNFGNDTIDGTLKSHGTATFDSTLNIAGAISNIGFGAGITTGGQVYSASSQTVGNAQVGGIVLATGIHSFDSDTSNVWAFVGSSVDSVATKKYVRANKGSTIQNNADSLFGGSFFSHGILPNAEMAFGCTAGGGGACNIVHSVFNGVMGTDTVASLASIRSILPNLTNYSIATRFASEHLSGADTIHGKLIDSNTITSTSAIQGAIFYPLNIGANHAALATDVDGSIIAATTTGTSTSSVVLSASPTLTGTVIGASSYWTGTAAVGRSNVGSYTFTAGDGSGGKYINVDGGASGSNNGGVYLISNAGAIRGLLGTTSAVIGGAFDSSISLSSTGDQKFSTGYGGVTIQRLGISASTGDVTVNTGHLRSTGSIPAVTSCGTSAAITTGSSDNAGEFTEGTLASGCVVTFATAYASTPFCTVTEQSGLAASYTTSNSAITITNIGALSSTKLNYACMGH